MTLQLKKESALRMDCRDREAERDMSMKRRLDEGNRPHFVHVNEEGRPYGLGITFWNKAVCKYVKGLDPSYIDIRQQPFYLIKTLMLRPLEDFEYSKHINLRWLRTRIGTNTSS